MNIRDQQRKITQRIVVFTSKYPYIGPVLWILSIQYFIVQLIVITAWPGSHSWANNFISDLGNTVCGVYSGLYVCSPLHPLMNFSFGLYGVTMAIGSLLIYTMFRQTKWTFLGFILMSLSGFGTLLVGLFPENTISGLHQFGALLSLGIGNLAIIIIGLSLRGIRREFRVYTVLSGMVSLAAFALFASDIYLGIGRGGMERVTSYLFTIWMISFGIYMTAVRMRLARNRAS